MRIGLLSQWYEPEPVPIPAVLARELVKRGHTVRVLTGFPNFPSGHLYDGYKLAWRLDGNVSDVAVRRVGLFPSHGPSALGRVLNYASFAATACALGTGWFKGIDALWVYNSPPTVGLPTWFVKSRYRPRIVMHVMDLWPESLAASGFDSSLLSRRFVREAIDRWLHMTYEMADAIACTSHSQIEILAARGVPFEKLTYVPVWTDETIFHPLARDEQLARELGVDDKTVLLYAGAIGEPQGLDVLVEACERLTDEPRFRCIVAGSGVAEPRLKAEANKRGLANISFIGRRPIREMTRLMSVGDVHFVSLRSDPLARFAVPSKLAAILACGKPVIVAAYGDPADIVAASGAGWTCPPGNVDRLEHAIRSALATDAKSVAEIGRRARGAYDAEFSVTAAVDRLEVLLSMGRNRDTNVA